ncbi:MAG: YadA-like family protein, partial [Citrobacter pasteurii]
ANSYTDVAKQDAISTANSYTDTTTATAKNEAIATANSYTDVAKADAISTSYAYTDTTSAKNRADGKAYVDNSLTQANNYTDNKFSQLDGRVNNLDNKIDDNDKQAKAGIAGAMAMTAIPQKFGYDFNFGMGAATFGGEQSMAAGAYYNVGKNATLSAKASLDTQHNTGVAVGLSFGF